MASPYIVTLSASPPVEGTESEIRRASARRPREEAGAALYRLGNREDFERFREDCASTNRGRAPKSLPQKSRSVANGRFSNPTSAVQPRHSGRPNLPHIGHSQRADPAIRSKESGHSAIGRWPAHSMTSSARVSNACGDLTPRARAVFELIRTQTWSAPVPADRLGARPGRSGTHPPSGAWATYVEISPRAAR